MLLWLPNSIKPNGLALFIWNKLRRMFEIMIQKNGKEILEQFTTAGTESGQIDVKISHKIIQLFSEGLYSSPHKAIEELVSNSFDAGAQNVHIVLSPDLRDPDATILIIDDGEGMNAEQLKQHWIIGKSTRRNGSGSGRRKPIGKFGIGKLSTYVLSSKLTHICKSENKFYAATMDYGRLSAGDDDNNGIFDEQTTINIPLRVLTREEAQNSLRPWTYGKGEGYEALDLFGENEPESWTVAIMSGLKKMGKEIKLGRLKWVLKTAMPHRSDFKLFLDGNPVKPTEPKEPLEKWIIGKDIVQMPKPCPEDLIRREDINEPEDSIHRYGVYHDQTLGRITGYIEIFENRLDVGKDKFGQSNGFFVYVRGRMVNEDDLGFGIERNQLQHGTFSRFRTVVYIDSLDDVLRSSRESFQQGELYKEAQNFLRACFNFARNHFVEHDRRRAPGSLISARISSLPGSLTRKPLLSLAQLVAENKATPFYFRFPYNLSDEDQDKYLKELEKRAQDEGSLLRSTEINPLDSREGLAVLDVYSGKLEINSSHPFIAAFQDFFENSRNSLPLEMLVISEVFMEAYLYHIGLDESVIRYVIARRDELLRQLVKSSARRTAGMIALALTEARDDPNKLEEEMRAAFEAIGFDDVIRIGGSGNPDGTAEAYLAATEDGKVQRYKVGLEAKSGKSVDIGRLGVSRIARHMRKYDCDHHLVIGNEFTTARGTAIVDEIKQNREDTKRAGKERTITLMYIDDLARLVRIVSSRRVGGLKRLRDLFRNCITPEESRAWVNQLSSESTENWPYKEILAAVWHLAQEQPNEPVEYAAVIVELRHSINSIQMTKRDLIDCCKAMQVMASGLVFAHENTIEIDRRPDLILEDIKAAVCEYQDEERRLIRI